MLHRFIIRQRHMVPTPVRWRNTIMKQNRYFQVFNNKHQIIRANVNHNLFISGNKRYNSWWSKSSFSKSYDKMISSIKVVREEIYYYVSIVPTVVGYVLLMKSMVHCVDEYGFRFILCEGPSMSPTFQYYGDIILVERISYRIHGLTDSSETFRIMGDSTSKDAMKDLDNDLHRGVQRERRARVLQREWERKMRKSNKKEGKDSKENDRSLYTWHQALNNTQPPSIWDKIREKFMTGISVGDVIVIESMEKAGTACKRVIGLPGDTIIVNSEFSSVNRGFFEDKDSRSILDMFLKLEDNNRPRRQKLVVVPDGHLWIEGDNTLQSNDSRYYGPIPMSLIVGKVVGRVWPLQKMQWVSRGPRPLPKSERESYRGSIAIPCGYQGEPLRNKAPQLLSDENSQQRFGREIF